MTAHKEFKDLVISLDTDQLAMAPEGKWSADQQLSHVVKSLKAIHTGFSLPKFQLKLMFGKSNRPLRTYDEVVERYHQKLAAGYENRSAYMPSSVDPAEVKELADKMMSYASRISKKIGGYSEEDLDTYLLPHPLIGKMTLREMGYFTAYHCRHHMRFVREYTET